MNLLQQQLKDLCTAVKCLWNRYPCILVLFRPHSIYVSNTVSAEIVLSLRVGCRFGIKATIDRSRCTYTSCHRSSGKSFLCVLWIAFEFGFPYFPEYPMLTASHYVHYFWSVHLSICLSKELQKLYLGTTWFVTFAEARTKFLLLHLKVACSEPWHIAVLQVLEEIHGYCRRVYTFDKETNYWVRVRFADRSKAFTLTSF